MGTSTCQFNFIAITIHLWDVEITYFLIKLFAFNKSVTAYRCLRVHYFLYWCFFLPLPLCVVAVFVHSYCWLYLFALTLNLISSFVINVALCDVAKYEGVDKEVGVLS